MQKVVLLFFVLFSCLGMAQDKKEIDSLLSNIAKLEKPDSKVRTNTSKVDVILKMSTEAYYQAKEIDYTEGRARALIFIIKNYIHIGDFKAALERINEGISFTQGEESTQKYRVSFFVLKGSVLSQLGYSDEAKINFNNAAEIIEMVPEFSADAEHYKKILKHASFILSYEQEKAQPLGNKKENEQYLQEAYKEVGQIKNNSTLKTVLYVHILRSLVSYYTESNELDRAEYYITEGDKLYSDYPGWLIKRNFLLGAIEKKRQNYTKAIEAYNMALQIAEQYQFKYAEKQIYNWISECYHELKDYKNESLYLDKSKKLSDSLNLAEKATTGDVLKHETKNKSEETSFWKSSALYYLIAVLFIIIVIVIILKQKSIRSNTADRIAEKAPEHEEEQLDHEALNLLIGLAEKDDPSFYFKFNEAFPNFSDNLLKISPKLTQSDIEYCAMMKLNFDTKKIASIKRLSIGAVESKKYRIRKKLDISTEENIYIWLMDK